MLLIRRFAVRRLQNYFNFLELQIIGTFFVKNEKKAATSPFYEKLSREFHFNIIISNKFVAVSIFTRI